MVSWYSILKITKDGEARNGVVSSNVEQGSQLINGPQEFWIRDHKSLELMCPIALHGKEN